MSESLNPNAVDAALASGEVAPKVDMVPLSVAEVTRLRAIEDAHKGLERDTAASLIERDLDAALSGYGLVPGASPQLQRLWASDFTARRIDGRFQVEGKAGGSVAEVVRARLESQEYAHFLKATARTGGTGAAAGSQRSAPTGETGRPMTEGERMIAREIEKQKAGGWHAKYRQ